MMENIMVGLIYKLFGNQRCGGPALNVSYSLATYPCRRKPLVVVICTKRYNQPAAFVARVVPLIRHRTVALHRKHAAW